MKSQLIKRIFSIVTNRLFNQIKYFGLQERRLHMYVKYCQNKPLSEYLVQKYKSPYFTDIQAELKTKLDIADYLIKPVQRIMKYQLLLKVCVSYFDWKCKLYSTNINKITQKISANFVVNVVFFLHKRMNNVHCSIAHFTTWIILSYVKQNRPAQDSVTAFAFKMVNLGSTSWFLDAYEPSALHLSNHPNAEHLFWGSVCKSGQAGPPQQAECLVPLGTSVYCVSQWHNGR